MADLLPVNNSSAISPDSVSTGRSKAAKAGTGFSAYLDNAGSLDDIFRKASQKYNVPIELLKAVAKAESNFNPNAVSKAGAQGIMQLMPATARELGVVNSFDPVQNIMGGAKYLSGLLKKFNGDISLALAAYNAGSGNVKKYGGIPPFKETRNYVVKVMRYMNEDIDIPASSNKLSSGRIRQAHKTAPANNNLSGNVLADDGRDSILDELFSYDDYLKLIDFLTREDKTKNEEEDKKKSSIDPIITPSYINLIN